MAITVPKGMRDMLPDEAAYWRSFQDAAADVFGKYGYCAIDTPIVEKTELFVRGIGESTDVVSKEMFNVISGENLDTLVKGGHISSSKRMSLRPEGTAGVVRAVVQHDLVPQGAPPVKLMYAGPMFRAEQPQEGRYRQFRQIGVECLGADDPTIDAEGIIMCMRFFERIGFDPSDLVLLVNSIGCDECRPAYRDRVRDFAAEHSDGLCENCRARMEANPLRMFDCKEEGCRRVMADAPLITDALCDDCAEHYRRVLAMLDGAGVPYVEDPKLVRGLDYYGRTVFEVQSATKDGAQNAVGGGGRYDRLADEIRGKKTSTGTPGFGFAIGYERCKEALLKKGMSLPRAGLLQVFAACAGEEAADAVFGLVTACRDADIVCDMDHQHRSLKSQFKVADRLGADYVAVIGEDELARGVAKIRDMRTREETDVPLSSAPTYLSDRLTSA